MSNPLKPGDVRPGSVKNLRQALEATLRKVAPVQCLLFKPKFNISHVAPTVLVCRLVGMKNLSDRQIHALETTIDDAKMVGSVVILSFGRGR